MVARKFTDLYRLFIAVCSFLGTIVGMVSNTEIAWAAGIFDGEGCISMNRQRASTRKDLVTDTYRLVVKVTMGDKPTILRIAQIFGVGTVHNHVGNKAGANASYSWVAQSQVAKAALCLVRPYLITKAEELALAFEFFALPSGTLGGAKGNPSKSPELQEAQMRCYWKLRMAKSRWRFYYAKLRKSDREELVYLGLFD